MITIKTHLDAGIYRSSGGGETRTHYSYNTGPRNLLAAIDQLHEHRREMEQGFGNIGCGRSWLEIDGVEISRYDLEAVRRDDSAERDKSDLRYWRVLSRTEKARRLIDSVKSGNYSIPDLSGIF